MEELYERLMKLLGGKGMVPAAAKRYASQAIQQGLIHEWSNGIISVVIDGRVDSTPHALDNLAARIVAGAPTSERRGGLSYEEQREFKADKIARDGADYGL